VLYPEDENIDSFLGIIIIQLVYVSIPFPQYAITKRRHPFSQDSAVLLALIHLGIPSSDEAFIMKASSISNENQGNLIAKNRR